MTLNGIDISSHQADLRIANLVEQPDFVVIKATEGKGYTSPTWAEQYADAKVNHRLVGLYHFARNDLGGDTRAVEEADYFLNTITPDVIGEAVLVLDWEKPPLGDVAWVKKWLDRVHERTGVRAVVYMSEWPAANYDWSPVAAAGHKLWVAKYRDNLPDEGWDIANAGPEPDVTKGGWSAWSIWQWTSHGLLDGHPGNLDLNVAKMTADEWRSLAAPEQDTDLTVCVTRDDLSTALAMLEERIVTSITAAVGELLIPLDKAQGERVARVLNTLDDVRASLTQELTGVWTLLAGVQQSQDRPPTEEEVAVLTTTLRALLREELAKPREISITVPGTLSGGSS